MANPITTAFVAVVLAGAFTAPSSASAQVAPAAPRFPLLSPNPRSTFNVLTGVSALSASRAWAVGYYRDDATGARKTLILHWDGTSWKLVASPNPSSHRNWLYGVAANGADDAWGVGFYKVDATGARDALILRWDGSSWSQA